MIELLLSARGADSAEVLRLPEPLALFVGFGESALDFELRGGPDAFDRWPMVRSALALEVHRMLGDAGIEVPFPQRVVRVKAEPTATERCRDASGGGRQPARSRLTPGCNT